MNSGLDTTNAARIDIASVIKKIDRNLDDPEATIPALMKLAVERFLRMQEGTLSAREDAQINDATVRVMRACGATDV
jgi:hypothetical protein